MSLPKASLMTLMDLSETQYELPSDRIAEFPLAERDESRLLVAQAQEGQIGHTRFRELPRLLPQGTRLFVNTTRVIQARLEVFKKTGGAAEILCLEPLEPSPDPGLALSARGECVWQCLVGGKKIGPGDELTRDGLKAEILEKEGAMARVRFQWGASAQTFSEVLESLGKIPLPPYIKREPVELDRTRYQTVYAHHQGSVAAPTAGLHFTPRVLEALEQNGVRRSELTLHVGAGTFKPIETSDVWAHEMHYERVIVSLQALDELSEQIGQGPVLPVGTTSARTLESLYWWGALELLGRPGLTSRSGERELPQWVWRELLEEGVSLPEPRPAIQALIQHLKKGGLTAWVGQTQLMMLPGYPIQLCDGIITNFHQPGSTLILLVAAFLGKDLWRRAYGEALREGYRFLSYGDSSLLLRTDRLPMPPLPAG